MSTLTAPYPSGTLQVAAEGTSEPFVINVDHLITEDDTPADGLFSANQQHLLAQTLADGWKGEPDRIPYIAAANVGIFPRNENPALAPNFFLSLWVTLPKNLKLKKNHSYLIWEFGKPPEIVLEILSETKIGKISETLRKYALIKIEICIVFDPFCDFSHQRLRVFALQNSRYIEVPDNSELAGTGLRLCFWEGEYHGLRANWLRWTDLDGKIIPTAWELADQQKNRPDAEDPA